MPDAVEAPWQNVEEKAADELAGFERQGSVAGGAVLSVVLDAERDVGPVEGRDPARGDRDPVGVARQIGEDGLRPREGRLGIDDPTLATHRREMPGEGSAIGKRGERAVESKLADLVERDKPFEEQAAEQGCKNPHRQEEGGTRSDPSRSVPRETAAWDDHVQMRMMGHRRAPGVKDGGEADAGAEMVRVCGNRRHRLRGRPEQEIVDGPLVLEGDCRDFGWQREDDVEVSDRQEVSLSCFQPITGRRTLAARAMPVAAGVVSDPQMAGACRKLFGLTLW